MFVRIKSLFLLEKKLKTCNYYFSPRLNHASEQIVDVLFTVAEVTTLSEVVGLLLPAAVRVVELEGPEEVGRLLEVRADGENLVDQVLNANDAVFAYFEEKSFD